MEAVIGEAVEEGVERVGGGWCGIGFHHELKVTSKECAKRVVYVRVWLLTTRTFLCYLSALPKALTSLSRRLISEMPSSGVGVEIWVPADFAFIKP